MNVPSGAVRIEGVERWRGVGSRGRPPKAEKEEREVMSRKAVATEARRGEVEEWYEVVAARKGLRKGSR